jgi:hypothetical protein
MVWFIVSIAVTMVYCNRLNREYYTSENNSTQAIFSVEEFKKAPSPYEKSLLVTSSVHTTVLSFAFIGIFVSGIIKFL